MTLVIGVGWGCFLGFVTLGTIFNTWMRIMIGDGGGPFDFSPLLYLLMWLANAVVWSLTYAFLK